MTIRTGLFLLLFCAFANRGEAADPATVAVPSFALPFSAYASPEAKEAFIHGHALVGQLVQQQAGLPIDGVRKLWDEKLFLPSLERQQARYHTTITETKIAGIPVYDVLPAEGVAPENKDRVLIDLHGGAFVMGAGANQKVESVPIAAVGKIRVVSVDYRMAPEAKFPAASQDVAAVYRELLKRYKPQDIGIYGCSAGGMLTAESIAWFRQEKLPLPGAIGIFCAATGDFTGDSTFLASAALGDPPPPAEVPAGASPPPYFAGVAPTDPLAYPTVSDEVLRVFPPTLFITGSRAFESSAAEHSHLQLVTLGVSSQLLVFEGMGHGFFADPDLPESRQAYQLIARFFAANLGKHR